MFEHVRWDPSLTRRGREAAGCFDHDRRVVADATPVQHLWHLGNAARERELVEHPAREGDKHPIDARQQATPGIVVGGVLDLKLDHVPENAHKYR
eukprot:4720633-Pyramimonas_sp.AAC.1